jgi:ATP-dependent protease ClpP protease subunit
MARWNEVKVLRLTTAVGGFEPSGSKTNSQMNAGSSARCLSSECEGVSITPDPRRPVPASLARPMNGVLKLREAWSLITTTVVVVALCGVVSGDTIWSHDNVQRDGEILRNVEGQPIVFRCFHGGVWRTFSVPRDRISRFQIEPGDQSDGSGNAAGRDATSATGDFSGSPSEQPETSAVPKVSLSGTSLLTRVSHLRPIIQETVALFPPVENEVVVLHLNGPFREARLNNLGAAVSATVFRAMLEAACERNPKAIVLRINSPGGLVTEMDEIVECLLEAQTGNSPQRVVAWVELGGSAAAVAALACKEIVMMPQGRLGAATKIYTSGDAVEPPKKAIDQKIESMGQARRRQVAELTSRPLALQDAMEYPEHQFWAHPISGFSLTKPAGKDWEAFDTDATKPLTLNASELVRLKIAKAIVSDKFELVTALSLPFTSTVIDVNLAEPWFQDVLRPTREVFEEGTRCIERYQTKLIQAVDRFDIALRRARGIAGAAAGYTMTDLRALKSAISRCTVPAVDPEVRRFLKETDADELERYEASLVHARRLSVKANQSASQHTSTLPVGGVIADLELARKLLWDVIDPSE